MSRRTPLLLRYRSSTTFIIITAALTMFTDYFYTSLVNPVLPFALTSRAHVSTDKLQQWTSVLYAIFCGMNCLCAPFYGIVFGHQESQKVPLLIGLAAMFVSITFLCIGSSLVVLIIGRIIQGISGALIYTGAQVMLVNTVGHDHIGRVMGWMGSFMNAATIIAPTIGGITFDYAGYEAVFGVMFGFAGLDEFFRIFVVEKCSLEHYLSSDEESNGPQQIRGKNFITVNVRPSMSSGNTLCEPISPRKQPKVQQSRRLLTSASFAFRILSTRLLVAMLATMVQASLITSFETTLPVFVYRTFGWSSTGAGLIFLPLLLPSLLGPVVGMVSDKHGTRWPTLLGLGMACPGYICLRFVMNNTLKDKAILCVLLIVDGMAITLIMISMMSEVAQIAESRQGRNSQCPEKSATEDLGMAYSWFNFSFSFGCLLGPLLSGFLVEGAGWQYMGLALGLLSAVSIIPVSIWTGKTPHISSNPLENCCKPVAHSLSSSEFSLNLHLPPPVHIDFEKSI